MNRLKKSRSKLQLQAEQHKIVAASTELQFNLNVMIRLQEVLFIIAADKKSRDKVWGDLPDGKYEVLAGDAFLMYWKWR